MLKFFKGEDLIEGDDVEQAKRGDFDYGVESDWFGGVELRGERPTQEDSMFAYKLEEEEAKAYATLEKEQKSSLLQAVTRELSQQLRKNYEIANDAGATGMVAIIEPNPATKKCEVIVANLGDSQLFVVNLYVRSAIRPTIERQNTLHNPSEPLERARLTEKNIEIVKDRLPDGLAVSRSFGDFFSHEYGLIEEPEVTYKKYSVPEGGELIFIAACDGLTNEKKFNPKSVLKELIKYTFKAGGNKNLRKLAHHLGERASPFTKDNVSLEIVKVTAETEATPMILGIFDGHSRNGIDGATISGFLRIKWLEVFTRRLLNMELSLPDEAEDDEVEGTPPTQSYHSPNSSTDELKNNNDLAGEKTRKKFKAVAAPESLTEEEEEIIFAQIAESWKFIEEQEKAESDLAISSVRKRKREGKENLAPRGSLQKRRHDSVMSDDFIQARKTSDVPAILYAYSSESFLPRPEIQIRKAGYTPSKLK